MNKTLISIGGTAAALAAIWVIAGPPVEAYARSWVQVEVEPLKHDHEDLVTNATYNEGRLDQLRWQIWALLDELRDARDPGHITSLERRLEILKQEYCASRSHDREICG